MSLLARSSLVAGIALLATASAIAQPPSYWTKLALPATASSVNAIGTTVTFKSTNAIHFYSGVTKKWVVLPTVSAGPLFQANDYAIVADNGQLHGFSATTGKIESIPVSGSQTVVSGSASSSWVTLVADGTQAWGFSAFLGQWVPLTLSAPNPVMVSSRLIGMIRDGSTVYGFNANYGTFVPVAADTSATLTVVGEAEVGTAHSPGVFRAFSAQHNNWGVQTFPTTSKLQQNEYALAWSGNTALAFSGLSGTFATYNANNPISSISNAEGVAAFLDGNDAVCYGSGQGTFATLNAPGASFSLDYHLAMVSTPSSLTPFSALTCAFGSPLAGTYGISSNDCIAYVDGATTDYAYSPILNQWTAAPNVPTIIGPALVRSSVILPVAGGYYALSARYGTWEQVSTGLNGSFSAPTTGSTFVAFDGVGDIVHVFDARLNRWAVTQGAGPLSVSISRHTAMAIQGTTGFGFGQPNGEWDTIALANPGEQLDVASSIGIIKDATELNVYSVQGSLSYTSRFPEFTRATNLGNTLSLYQVGPANSSLVMFVGLVPARIEVSLLIGNLYIDPNSMFTLGVAQTIGSDGLVRLDIPLPQSPVLVGARPHIQNAVLPPAGGQPYLTSSVAPILF